MDLQHKQTNGEVPGVVSPYLTVTEASSYLRRSVGAVYSLVKRGRLTPMPGSPGRLLFTRPQLDKFLQTPPRRGRSRRRGKSTESDT
jgi:excisionase family DNA binding protein